MKKAKIFSGFSWILGFIVVISLCTIFWTLDVGAAWCSGSAGYWRLGDWFLIDSVSWYLTLLTVVIWLSIVYDLASYPKYVGFAVNASVISALFCYISNNAVVFWVFYEISIISLLFLIYSASAYSERFVALWYFLGYILVSGLPSLLSILYLCKLNGSLFISHWGLLSFSVDSSESWVIYVVLAVLFISKVPLIPFHSWLPVVHSEASSVVSSCLSGYIMKLGFLGLVRFGVIVVPEVYIYVCLVSSCIFFGLALVEVDVKRWLAYMSLAHAVAGLVCLVSSEVGGMFYCFYYSVGHGLGACLGFMILGFGQRSCFSRSWLVVRRWLWSNVLLLRVVSMVLLMVASVPPTLQFFVEVEVVKILASSGWMMYVFGLSLYLGVVGPIVVLSLLFGSSPRDWCSVNCGSDGVEKMLGLVLFLAILLLSLFVLL